MPSFFPGMDPFIESQRWRDFHTRFVAMIGEMLTPCVRPRYIVEVEEYVYLVRGEEPPDRLIEPDVAIVQTEGTWQPEAVSNGGVAVAVQPVLHTVPMPRRFRQAFLTIRTREY